jgi:hypothetical protein
VGLGVRNVRRENLTQLFERVIWITLLAIIPLAAIPHGLFSLWWQAAFECLVFALGALWVLNGFLGGSWPIWCSARLLFYKPHLCQETRLLQLQAEFVERLAPTLLGLTVSHSFS